MRACFIASVIAAACVTSTWPSLARAAGPDSSVARGVTKPARQSHWRLDHYVYDAALHRNWAVLMDSEDPGAPERMVLVPGQARELATHRVEPKRSDAAEQTGKSAEGWRESKFAARPDVRVGEAVQISNAPDAPASFLLAGTAEESAGIGRTIRVRLSANGAQVRAIVRGPHSVELAVGSKPVWRAP